MKTEKYLGQVIRLDYMIKNKIDEIQMLKSMAGNISVSNNSDRIQASSDKDKISALVAKIVDMELNVDKMIDKRCNIVTQIERMDNVDSYDILANVYILGRDLKVVAIEKQKSYRHFLRLHEKALKEFEKKYGKLYLES